MEALEKPMIDRLACHACLSASLFDWWIHIPYLCLHRKQHPSSSSSSLPSLAALAQNWLVDSLQRGIACLIVIAPYIAFQVGPFICLVIPLGWYPPPFLPIYLFAYCQAHGWWKYCRAGRGGRLTSSTQGEEEKGEDLAWCNKMIPNLYAHIQVRSVQWFLPTYLSVYWWTYLPAHLPTSTYPPSYLFTYLPTYLYKANHWNVGFLRYWQVR